MQFYAGWPSTIGLVWYSSISCITCAPCRFPVCVNGAYEATSSENHLFYPTSFPSWWIVCSFKHLITFVFHLQTDDSSKNTLLVLKFLPLMIGYFSLSVPSGLSIYWLVIYLRHNLLLGWFFNLLLQQCMNYIFVNCM